MDLPEDVTATQATLAMGNRIVINVPAGQRFWRMNGLRNNPGFLLRVYGLNRETGRAPWEKAPTSWRPIGGAH
jgi:hypothetical protein